jgi:hypothetical protein
MTRFQRGQPPASEAEWGRRMEEVAGSWQRQKVVAEVNVDRMVGVATKVCTRVEVGDFSSVGSPSSIFRRRGGGGMLEEPNVFLLTPKNYTPLNGLGIWQGACWRSQMLFLLCLSFAP